MSLSEEEVDDLLHLARYGEYDEFDMLREELCGRKGLTTNQLLYLTKDKYSGNGALHMAAANGHSDFIRKICTILSTPSPQNQTMLSILNTRNSAGNTALHWAALNGHLESVKALIDQGADPTITNKRGHDAIYQAELNDKNEVVDWVLKEGGKGLEEGLGDLSVGNDKEKNDKVCGIHENSEEIIHDLGKISLDVET